MPDDDDDEEEKQAEVKAEEDDDARSESPPKPKRKRGRPPKVQKKEEKQGKERWVSCFVDPKSNFSPFYRRSNKFDNLLSPQKHNQRRDNQIASITTNLSLSPTHTHPIY